MPAFLCSHIGGLPRAFRVLWSGALVNRLGAMVEPYLAIYLTDARSLSVTNAGLVLAVWTLGEIVMVSVQLAVVAAGRWPWVRPSVTGVPAPPPPRTKNPRISDSERRVCMDR